MFEHLLDSHAVVNYVIGAFGATATAFFAARKGWLSGILNAGVDKVNQYFQNRWGVAVPESIHTWEHSTIEYAVAWMEKNALSPLWWRTLAWDTYNKNPARLVALREEIAKIDPVAFVEGMLPPAVKDIVNEFKQAQVKKVVEAKVLSYKPGITLDEKIAATATAAKVNFPVEGEKPVITDNATKETVLKVFDMLIAQSEKRQEALSAKPVGTVDVGKK